MNTITEDRLSKLRKEVQAHVDLREQQHATGSHELLALVHEAERQRALSAAVYQLLGRLHGVDLAWLDMLVASAQGGYFDPAALPDLPVDRAHAPDWFDWFRVVQHPQAGAVLVQCARDDGDPAVTLTVHVEGKIGTTALAYESNRVRDEAYRELSDAIICEAVDKMLPPIVNHIPNT